MSLKKKFRIKSPEEIRVEPVKKNRRVILRVEVLVPMTRSAEEAEQTVIRCLDMDFWPGEISCVTTDAIETID